MKDKPVQWPEELKEILPMLEQFSELEAMKTHPQNDGRAVHMQSLPVTRYKAKLTNPALQEKIKAFQADRQKQRVRFKLPGDTEDRNAWLELNQPDQDTVIVILTMIFAAP